MAGLLGERRKADRRGQALQRWRNRARRSGTRAAQDDLILDLAGHATLSRLRRALIPDRMLVMVGGEDGGKWTGGFGRRWRAPLLSSFVPQRLIMLASKERASDQGRLVPLRRAGGPRSPGELRTHLPQGGATSRS